MQNKSQRPRTADDSDRVAKWLRRWTANPIRSPCVATNPFPVGIFFPTGRKEATYAGKKLQTQSEKIHCRRNHTDFKLCDRLAEWLKRWTANPKYGLRAWVRIPILSVFFSNESGRRKLHNNFHSQGNQRRYIAEQITKTSNFRTL